MKPIEQHTALAISQLFDRSVKRLRDCYDSPMGYTLDEVRKATRLKSLAAHIVSVGKLTRGAPVPLWITKTIKNEVISC